MTEQMSFEDRLTKSRRHNPSRPHHRTTILTTNRKTFDRVNGLRSGGIVKVEATNDIVSSARGGHDDEHHMLRRSALIRRQIQGGFRKVKVRTDNSASIECRIIELQPCADDECSFFVLVTKPTVV